LSALAEDELARLLRAAIAGDENAYERFLHQAARCVRGFVQKRIVKGGVDPEDVVQETLLAIHLKRHTWREDGPVMPWIYAIARHKLIDAFRRQGRRIHVGIGDVADSYAEPEPDAVSELEIGRALKTLTPGQRAVVSAVSVEGHSIGETAMSLGMSDTAVRVALHRGLNAIFRRFGTN